MKQLLKVIGKKYIGWLILAIVLSVVGSGTLMYLPILFQKVLDVAVPAGDVSVVKKICGVALILILISVLCSSTRYLITSRMGQRMIYDIRERLFIHLQKLDVSYFDKASDGKIQTVLVNYVNGLSDVLSNGIVNVLLEVMNMIYILVFMFCVNVKLSFVILAGVPFMLLYMYIINKKQSIGWTNLIEKETEAGGILQEELRGMMISRAFFHEEKSRKKFSELLDKRRKAGIYVNSYSSMVWPGIDFIGAVVRCAVYFVGLMVIAEEQMTVGVILAMATYASSFWQPLINLGTLYNSFVSGINYIKKIAEIMNEAVLVKDEEKAEPIGDINGNVEFEDVSFSYDEEIPVLSNVSMKIKAGQSVAFVGPTGAGKTTIVNLISRFYDACSGKILIDGKDIRKYTQKSIRSQMGIMLQESQLFTGTIEENIRYGKPDATMEEVVAACRIAQADKFIEQLPNGYQTIIQGGNDYLSQGQKELVALARTIVTNPRILILDEATANIDVQTEQMIQKGLVQAMEGRTSFVIAHRLSTIINSDIIMYIDHGGIAEQGTHAELMQKKGLYYQMFVSQLC